MNQSIRNIGLIANAIRNIGIIAHVDHGKTTLVDRLLAQAGARLSADEAVTMDFNTLEQERGITIFAKNAAIQWTDQANVLYHINIIDTPGHADFGGEVERALSMVNAVLLVVDAVDGPMPQTRFVTKKAFARGLNPIVVINKIDRPGARPDWVMEQVFDLFDHLGANNTQLDFPVIYASALSGYAITDLNDTPQDMTPLLQMIVDRVVPPQGNPLAPFQMQISSLDYSSYVGVIGIGLIARGTARSGMPVSVLDSSGKKRMGRILQVLGFSGLERFSVDEAGAGEIVAITGLDGLRISDTVCSADEPEALPILSVDEPTVGMTFQVNQSPFAGREGKFLTSRQISERLDRELISNVALRVEKSEDANQFQVLGRGELHLSILIETMRREGYELAVSRPVVVTKTEAGVIQEPFEFLMLDIEEMHQGAMMQHLAERKGELLSLVLDGKGRVRMEYMIPTRGLIGFHSKFLTLTSGSGVMHHVFDHYAPQKSGDMITRHRGVLVANALGVATAYALWNLQDRGEMMIVPQTEIYEGMIVGLHTRENDLVVNVGREKHLTNVRAAGSDENILLKPPMQLTLEQALDFIASDELVEVTPKSIRLRKKILKEGERKRSERK